MKKLLPTSIFLLFFHFHEICAQDLYALDTITKIELSFVEEDWEYPLHYYHSLKKGDRHIGHAIINGSRFDSVGVRFKGFSSYRRNFKKNPLNIKLDYIHKKADFQKHKTLKLSNGNLDPSWLREILAYQIARKYMAAPQSNYAQVFVNDKYYGLFGNTESVDEGFAKRHFHADKKCLIVKGNSPLGPFSGKRSSLEYLGENPNLYTDSYEINSDKGWQELSELIHTLKFNPEKIEEVLNMDGAIWMLAFNNVLVNLDSYSDFQQNYYLIKDKNDRFNFVVWDLNLAFDGLGKPKGVSMQADYNPLEKINDERYPLINLVLKNPTYRKIYFAHCRTILKENFSNNWYKEEIEKHRKLISEAVMEDTNWAFPYEAFEQNYLREYISNKSTHYPYPGIIELMEARKKYLEKHPEYKKTPPVISEIQIDFSSNDSLNVIISAEVKNTENTFLFYRKKSSHIFKKTTLNDEGKNGDTIPGDNIFSTTLPLEGKKIQYFIFAENNEAAFFAPERAEYEYYTFSKKQ